jgi:hypothetical protein
MADDCGEYKVQVYLYDLSQGMVKGISQGFLGKQIGTLPYSSKFETCSIVLTSV